MFTPIPTPGPATESKPRQYNPPIRSSRSQPLLGHKTARTTHILRHQARPSILAILFIPTVLQSSKAGFRHARLRIDHTASAPRSLHEPGVLLDEDLEVPLRLPVEDAVRREDQVHLLERALVGFGVEGPNDDDGEDVDAAENVQRGRAEFCEDGGQQEGAPSVADRPADYTPCVALCSDLKREDLGGV